MVPVARLEPVQPFLGARLSKTNDFQACMTRLTPVDVTPCRYPMASVHLSDAKPNWFCHFYDLEGFRRKRSTGTTTKRIASAIWRILGKPSVSLSPRPHPPYSETLRPSVARTRMGRRLGLRCRGRGNGLKPL